MSALVASWAMDQVLNKTVTVHVGTQALSYQQMPDDSYMPPAGVTTQLVKVGATHKLIERTGEVSLFDADNNLTKYTDADSNNLILTYTSGKLTQVKDSYLRTLTLGYTSNKLTSVTDSTGRSVSYIQTNGNLTHVTGLQSAPWDYTYDAPLNRLKTVTNPVGKKIVDNTYDDFDRVIAQIAPRDTGLTTYKLHYAGFLSSEEDPLGNRTTYHYDINGRTVATEDALGNISRLVYNGQGHVTHITDPRGYSTILEYDGNQNLTKQINDSGKSVSFFYEPDFDLDYTFDQLTHKTDFDYDAEHHLTSVKDALLHEVITAYYPNGLVDTVKDPRGAITKFIYDTGGYLDTTKVGTHPVLNTDYNTRGYLVKMTNQEAGVTSFIRDTRGFATQQTDYRAKISTPVHNTAGQLTSYTDRKGTLVSMTYTDSGKLDVITYPTSTVNFNYDSRDNLRQMIDPSGTTTNVFDDLNRLKTQTDPNGFIVGYAYDPAGNVKTMTYPGGKTVTYGYDNLNRLSTVTIDWLASNKQMTYQYDDANRLADIYHFNALHTDINFDDANRLQGIVLDGNGVLASYAFTPDANGNRQFETIAAEPIKPEHLINDSKLYTYNNEHSRLKASSNHSYGYDNEGQQTSRDGMIYSFDAAHRLTGVGNSTFVYDGVGNRIRATRDGVLTKYIYDAAGNLLAEANNAGAITRYYIYGLGLTAMVKDTGEIFVYHFDGTGHTVALTNSAKVPVNRYAYSPYGEVLGQDEQVPQPFKYAGQVGVFTEANNLYYMRARYYDAETGRFISEDPAGFVDGPNLYAYVGGNPIGAVDPKGLELTSALYGGVVGAVTGYASTKTLNGSNIEALKAAGFGAAIGFGTGLVQLPLIGNVVAGAAGAAAGDYASQYFSGRKINNAEIIGSGVGGALIGLLPTAPAALLLTTELSYGIGTAAQGIGKGIGDRQEAQNNTGKL